MEEIKFLPCGDSAVTVEFSRAVSEDVNAKIRYLAAEEIIEIHTSRGTGGWRLIGRTPIKVHDPNREEPILYRAGDYIRFVRISEDKYARILSDTSYVFYAPC